MGVFSERTDTLFGRTPTWELSVERYGVNVRFVVDRTFAVKILDFSGDIVKRSTR